MCIYIYVKLGPHPDESRDLHFGTAGVQERLQQQWLSGVEPGYEVRDLRLSKSGVPSNGWFMKENPSKVDGLEIPLFQQTPI